MGSRDGAVVKALASHRCVPSSIPGPGVICGLSLLLVLFLAPRCFSPGTPVFPSPQKPTFPNSNLIWIIVKHFIMSQALYHEPNTNTIPIQYQEFVVSVLGKLGDIFASKKIGFNSALLFRRKKEQFTRLLQNCKKKF